MLCLVLSVWVGIGGAPCGVALWWSAWRCPLEGRGFKKEGLEAFRDWKGGVETVRGLKWARCEGIVSALWRACGSVGMLVVGPGAAGQAGRWCVVSRRLCAPY